MPKVPAYNRSLNLVKGEPDKSKIKKTTIDRAKYQSILDKPINVGDNLYSTDKNSFVPDVLSTQGFNYHSGTINGKDAVYKKGNNYYMYNERPEDGGSMGYGLVNIGDLSEPKIQPIQDTTVVPKQMPIDPMKVEGFNGMQSPIVQQFNKGGKVKGYALGTTDEGVEPTTGYQSAIAAANAKNNADAVNKANRNANIKQGTNVAGRALGAYGTGYFAANPGENSSEQTRSAALATVSQAGPVGGAIGGLAAIGDKIGKPIKERSEQFDENGNLIHKGKAENNAVIGGIFSGTKALATRQEMNKAGYNGNKVFGAKKEYSRYLEGEEKKRIQAERDAEIAATQVDIDLTNQMKLSEALQAREAGDVTYESSLVTPKQKEYSSLYDKKMTTEEAMAARQDLVNTATPQPSKGKGFLGKVGRGISRINFADGGVVEGAGTAKSDSINAKVEAGSFIVPAENASIAKELAVKVLRKAPSKKANLNQGGETPVKLSDGEYMFSPEEKMELINNGVDLEALAPNAEDTTQLKSGGRVPKYKKGTPPSGVNGGDFDKILSSINAQQNKIKQEQAKIRSINQAKIQAEKDANRKAELIKIAREAENTANQRALVLEAKKNKVEKLYSQYEAAPEKSTSSSVKPKQQYINALKVAADDYTKEYEKYNPSVNKTTNQYTADDFSNSDYGWKAPSKQAVANQISADDLAAADDLANADMTAQAAANATKVRKAPKRGVSAVSEQVDVLEPKTIGLPQRGLSIAGDINPNQIVSDNQRQMAAKEAAANSATETTAPQGKSFDWQGLGDNIVGYGLPIVQGAIGFKKLKELGKRPQGKLDQDYLNAIAKTSGDVSQARQNAKFGYTGEEMAALNQENAALTNTGRAFARNVAGGSASTGLGLERSVLNDSFGRKLQSKISDNSLKMQKQEQAMQRQQELNNMVANKAGMNRQLFEDTLRGWNQDQAGAGALVNAALSNALDTRRYNKFKAQYDQTQNQNVQ